MARLESVASGGYFPTPQHLVPLIRSHLVRDEGQSAHVVDPCAGDGEAVNALFDLIMGEKGGYLHTCEMEARRFAGLKKRLGQDWRKSHAVHGDTFRLEMSKGIALLFLNPPYDLDPVHGRLEQRFLERFTTALVEGGVVVFIVPHYALEASAETFASDYDNVHCFRFPEEDFAAFKQVVVFAKKVPTRLAPDSKILAKVKGWSKTVARCPVLGSDPTTLELPFSCTSHLEWHLREFDLKGLVQKIRPWRETSRLKPGTLTHVPHILPEVPVEDLLFRKFEVATLPRPAHIAAAIASGLFNGHQVTSETTGMPPLLVKGVFTREFVTIQENVNKDGDLVSVTQVQRPRLETTVLNLETHEYRTLADAGKGGDSIDTLGIEGLLSHYGPSLMGVMAEQCPVGYDPKRDAASLPLAPVGRPLYTAQEHSAKALYQLLGGPNPTRTGRRGAASADPSLFRRGKAAIFLGEIGTGKTAPVLALGNTIARRMLVLCPPHLLDSWRDETAAVLPDAEYRVLKDLEDVDALANYEGDRFLVAVVSREAAKLGHGWEAVSGPGCPKCGAPLPEGVDLAKKRVCCEATPLHLADDLARAAFPLAIRLMPYKPEDGNVAALLEGRVLNRQRKICAERLETEDAPEWVGFDSEWVEKTVELVTEKVLQHYTEIRANLLCQLLLADYQPKRIVAIAQRIAGKGPDWRLEGLARTLTCLLPFKGKAQKEIQEAIYSKTNGFHSSPAADLTALSTHGLHHHGSVGVLKLVDGRVTLDGNERESVELAHAILTSLCQVGHFPRAEECGEPLFQAVPEPRRYPLAKYIASRYPDLFDFLALDEGHEYSNGDTAQSHAAHRLTALGIPTVLMTGSLMNGYAESLFTNLWSLSPSFREEFARDEKGRFTARYGYHKRVLSEKDMDTKAVVAFGSNSDRVERSEKTAGHAPGVLPLLLFRHLLGISVTLHMADLALDLQPCRHIVEQVEPSPELAKKYKALRTALTARIKKDQFTPLSGKLFGMLAELPSYLDRATDDVGNQDDGSFGIYYPKAVGGDLVAKVEPIASKKILPKEQWMLDKVKSELAEGRNVMVFSWHVNLLPRLARLIEKEIGSKVPILYADKVPTAKRQDWINKNVVSKGARVMVANPVGIQTGLNNLVHFATEVWMENPSCHPLIFRQANGRVYRVGQKKESRIYFPIYSDTMQVALHELLMMKVAVSTATDGLDSESALLAAGAGDDALLMGLSIGRQLWAMLNEAA